MPAFCAWDASSRADRVCGLAFNSQNVGQERLYMASPFAAIPNITPLVRTIHHLSVAASYATEFGTGGSSMIFNNQQSVVIQKWLVM